MNRGRAWSPAEGPPAAPQQIPPRSSHVSGAGEEERKGGLWAPSEGPTRTEPGGPGGEPDGRLAPRPRGNPLGDP